MRRRPLPKLTLGALARPARTPEDDVPESLVSAYDLGAALGAGSAALVRRARRRCDGGEVAVKCVLQREEELQALAQEEFQILSKLAENCLLMDFATKLKVSDFNSAKIIGQGPGSSAMLSHRGTRAYAAPELILDGVWNERVDIWTCGIILYFMLLGYAPFDCCKKDIRQRFQSGMLPDLCWEDVSPSFQALVLQCLKVDMRQRPSAMELKKDALLWATHQDLGWLDGIISSWCECQTRDKRSLLQIPRAESWPR